MIAALTLTPSCRKNSNDESHSTPENLALLSSDVSSNVLSAKFRFPNDHQQALIPPKSHPLSGASFITEPDAFDDDLIISMKQAVPVANNKNAKLLGLANPMSSAGQAILIQSKENRYDANQPMEITLPVNMAQVDPIQNLTVLYHVMQQGPGGRNVIGLIKMDQLQRGEGNIKFRTPYFGIFQAVYYSGDPAAIAEVRSSDPFYGLDDPAARSPEAFLLQTPSGHITSAYPQASWSPSNGALSYEVLVTRNKDCSEITLRYDSVTSSSRTLESLNDGTYYLCVSAISPAGTRTDATNNGLEFILSTSQLGLFRYDSQRSFATATPQFKWTASQGASTYRAAIATSSGCPQPLEESVTDKLYWTPITKRADGIYYVCITAIDNFNHRQNITPDFGRPQGEGIPITIDTTKPGAFDILALGGPRNAVTWTSSSEAAFYNLIIASDETCSQSVRSYERIAGSQTAIEISGLVNDNSYHICLTSIDNAGNIRTANNNGRTFTYDSLAPKILTVESPTKTGSYPAGTIINININFTESVSMSGNSSDVRLQLNTDAYATYVKGAGTKLWQFTYRIASGENTPQLDYSSAQALAIGNSTLSDAAGNLATLILPAPGSPSSLSGPSKIAIDTIAPYLTSTKPADNDKDVILRPEILITLNENPNELSLSNAVIITKSSDQTNISSLFESSYNSTTRQIKLTPKSTSTLLAATAYKIQVRGIRDFANNEISPVSIQFTTK